MRFSLLLLGMIGVIVFLQYRMWFEPGGIHDMIKLRHQLVKEARENDRIKKSNDELVSQLKRMQYSQDATEYRARNELGMIKQGEVFYQIVK